MLANLWGTPKLAGLISDALDEVLKMLRQEKGMFETASRAFLTGETPEIDIAKQDQDINLGERLVRRLVLEHLALNPQQDLPASLALISIIHDVERIGDYAKSLSELALLRPPVMPNGPFADQSREIQSGILPLFDMTVKALEESDDQLAQQVMQQHRNIKQQTDILLRNAMEESNNTKNVVFFTVGSRFLRRISAHLSNIASSISNAFDQLGRNNE